MEAIDRTIVESLLRDGRISYTDLGKAIGLSTSAVHQRVRRLEERGIITGYTAHVDPNAIGLPLTAFVAIKSIDPAVVDDVPARLVGIMAIEGCYSVAGDEAYLLKVRVSSPLDLEALLATIRSTGAVSTRTTVVLSTPFEHRPPVVADEPTA